jgi:phosphoinositide-3-kinase regulatory subunit 4
MCLTPTLNFVSVQPDYDVSLDELLETLADQAGSVLVDAKSEVRRAALAHITQLCLVFGRTKTNDVLLIRMITYLNDQDWRLRCTFLESIVSVAAFVGATSLEEFVLPLMEQALAGMFLLLLNEKTKLIIARTP